ncbi:MAG TPA: hypothetical protein VNA04_08695 [Thermoanaerobaculia bacterium]|nr:hypothetical protein [Thermoanaerobaculia bacterium]
MRRLYPAVLVLLAGCSSGMDRLSHIEGGPGQDISIAIVEVEHSPVVTSLVGGRLYMIRFEVSNNSNLPVTVKRLSIVPSGYGTPFEVETSSRPFNEMIDPGGEHVFDLRVEARQVRNFRPEDRRSVQFRLQVTLASELTYYYMFEVPVRL